jgi:hypothetical protein
LLAIRHSADLKAKYEQPVAAGKEKKVAITVVMRKLIVLANVLLRDHRKWVEKTAGRGGYSSFESKRRPGGGRRNYPRDLWVEPNGQ